MNTFVDELLEDEREPIVSKRITPRATTRREKLLNEIDEADYVAARNEERRRAKRRQAKLGRRRNRKK